MDFLRALITAPVSIAVLFLLSKFIGNKQMSSLNLFDYINGITIGSIAAEMATTEMSDFWAYSELLHTENKICSMLWTGTAVCITSAE